MRYYVNIDSLSLVELNSVYDKMREYYSCIDEYCCVLNLNNVIDKVIYSYDNMMFFCYKEVVGVSRHNFVNVDHIFLNINLKDEVESIISGVYGGI